MTSCTLLALALAQAPAVPVLRYGGDAEGGAPYTFYAADRPGELLGFEVDIAVELGRRLGRRAEFFQNAWDGLVPALNRGDCEVVINGLEVTPERAREVAFTRPYYIFQQQLTVRREETAIRALGDLAGRRVGTLSGSLARDLLAAVEGAVLVTYSGQVEPYQDLALGRIDAVLLDVPIAVYYAADDQRLKPAGPPFGEGFYAIALRKGDTALAAEVDQALAAMIADGSLRGILTRWKLWSQVQERLGEGPALLARSSAAAAPGEHALRPPRHWARYLPALFSGALTTLGLSLVSMLLAVTLGLLLALAGLYGGGIVSRLATIYVEVIRGTPLLVQLYLLYYGVAGLGLKLPALVAAILGLGLNYAAYEAEIYRAGILAVPYGQWEAAGSLGMTGFLAFRRIILPQAVRTILPPMTGDFVALFKDTSIVSTIAVVELSKQYQILSKSSMKYLEIGLLTAALYLMMSVPLGWLSRRLEAIWGRGIV